MEQRLFEAALGIEAPWYVKAVDLDVAARVLTIRIDFRRGGRFRMSGVEGEHPVHDTVEKRYRHLNFFQHECHLVVRVPRVRLPDGRVRQVEPLWAGRLGGFTLLFEAPVADAGAGDAVCGGGAAGGRELAPGDGDLPLLCAAGPRAGGPVRGAGAGHRRDLAGAAS